MSINYRTNLYQLPESISNEDHVVIKVILKSESHDCIKLAGEMAAEQSFGSWVELPGVTEKLIEKHGAKVINAFSVPDYTDKLPDGQRYIFVELAYPTINFGYQLPMMFTSVAGIIGMMLLKVVDVKFPQPFLDSLPGPKFGIEGLRKYLNVWDRPLLLSMVKPCVGLSPNETAQLFYEVTSGGFDLIKDDEKIADTSYSSIADRVKAVMKKAKQVYDQTGLHKYYAVNITDKPDKLLENAYAAKDAGANMLMINVLSAGLGALQMVAESDVNLPILGHPDGVGAVSWSKSRGWSAHLMLGKFPRLCGSDIIGYGSSYSKIMHTQESSMRVALSMVAAIKGKKATFPMPAGAVHAGSIKPLMDDLGDDLVLGAGGGVYGHPMGAHAGAKSVYQALVAVKENRDLVDAAKEYKELAAAIDKWGICGDDTKTEGLLELKK